MVDKKMVVVVRDDLEMSEGKRAAQIAHAVKRSDGDTDYVNERIVCIVKTCNSSEALHKLQAACIEESISYGFQLDAGINELERDTATAICVGPDDPDKVFNITKKYRLLKGISYE